MRHETQRYDSVKATVEINVAGVGQTGLTPTVAVQDISTGNWLQSGGGSWDGAFATNNMTAVDGTNLPGLYEYDLPTDRVSELFGSTGGHEGFFIKIVETVNTLLEYVKVDIEFSPVAEPYITTNMTKASLDEALLRGLLDVTGKVPSFTAAAASGTGKFYLGGTGFTGLSARYVDRRAVLQDATDGSNPDFSDTVRIGGIFNDGGGDYFLLQNQDGTTYTGTFLSPGSILFILMENLTTRVGDIEDDVITSAVLADSAVDEIVDAVWDEDIVNFHGDADSSGLLLRTTSNLPSKFDISDQVWVEILADHSGVAGSTAKALSEITATAIADQVWEEPLGDHSGTAGSTAEALAAAGAAPSPADVADAVWDEALAGHHTNGTAGRALAITKGLVQGHHRIKDPTYDPDGRLLTAKLMVYPTAADATADTNEDFTFNVTCTYDGDGNLASLLSTE